MPNFFYFFISLLILSEYSQQFVHTNYRLSNEVPDEESLYSLYQQTVSIKHRENKRNIFDSMMMIMVIRGMEGQIEKDG